MSDPIENQGWSLIEKGFHPEYNLSTERLMGLGNGCFSQLANFEERFTGNTIHGNHLNCITHPDISYNANCKDEASDSSYGYVNAADWRGIDVRIGSEILDLNSVNILKFKRVLNIRTGILSRNFTVELPSGKQIEVDTHRFLSLVDSEIGAIKYTITPINFSDKITLIPFIGFETWDSTEKTDGKLWDEVAIDVIPGEGYFTAEVCKALIQVCTGMKFNILKNGITTEYSADVENRHKYIANIISLNVQEAESVTIEKFGINILSQNYPKGQLMEIAKDHLNHAFQKGFDRLEKEHVEAYTERWNSVEIKNHDDLANQMLLRFGQFRQFQNFPFDKAIPIDSELPEWLL